MALNTSIGSATSDSYITLAEWQAYWLARGVDLTAHGHENSHEANLRRAADTLKRRYSWKGRTQYRTQAQAWPRVDIGPVGGWDIAPDTVPQDVKDAQAELAYIIHEGGDTMATVTGGAVKRERVKADAVESETEYSAPRELPRYTVVEGLLRPYIIGMDSAMVVRG
jgi:hypothetical protein